MLKIIFFKLKKLILTNSKIINGIYLLYNKAKNLKPFYSSPKMETAHPKYTYRFLLNLKLFTLV
jgi:hypothetical protein